MKFADIEAAWEIDSVIDRSKIEVEALRSPTLHAKYYRMYVMERRVLLELYAEQAQLKIEVREFLLAGTSVEDKKAGRKAPNIKITKADLEDYLPGEARIVEMNKRIGNQNLKIEYLKSILERIAGRQWDIKNHIDMLRYNAGS